MDSILTRIERYYEFKTPVIWKNVFGILTLHLLGLYALTLVPSAKLTTIICGFFFILMGDLGLSAGVHRYWTHRSYKAKLPMRIIAMLAFMLAGQYSIVQWVRDHRMHHAFADTDADPHSAGRGLLFSHCGWLMMRRHPDLKAKGNSVDVSDVWEDPVVRFHQKYFFWLVLIVHVIMPSAVAYYAFGETLKNVIFISFFLRYCIALNFVWSINSLAHHFGYRPYNKNIMASGNAWLALILIGEGWHNFHHTFPWDYSVGEVSQRWKFSAHVIEMFAWIGLAYDLKTVTPELVDKVRAGNLPKNYEVPETELTNSDNKAA